jgi:putative protease
MAITCPHCGAEYDVALFEFGRRIRCDCGGWVDLASGHTVAAPTPRKEDLSMAEELIGRVTHFFGKINVAAIEITSGRLSVGDRIHIKGHTSDFTQNLDSLQVDGKDVQEVLTGQSVGIRVVEHAREHDAVYKITS